MLVAQAITSEKLMGGTSGEVRCKSSRNRVTLDCRQRSSCFSEREPHFDEVILEVIHLFRTTEGVLFAEAILGDVELIGEPSETPGSEAFDEDTSFEIRHRTYVDVHK